MSYITVDGKTASVPRGFSLPEDSLREYVAKLVEEEISACVHRCEGAPNCHARQVPKGFAQILVCLTPSRIQKYISSKPAVNYN